MALQICDAGDPLQSSERAPRSLQALSILDQPKQEETLIDFGTYIRQNREKAELSLAGLGRRVGVTPQHIFNIERGNVKATPVICIQLAIHLRLDSDEVMLMAGHTPPDVLTLLQENPQTGCALLRTSLK
ncbi:XRE family transcriptional regulator [bacterium]|nr:MAG: XRE family transcriptional regulator [bacterium]